MSEKNIFHVISDTIRQIDNRCILIGGYAVNYYHITRQTADIDFIVTQADYDKILPLLQSLGFHESYRQDVFVRLRAEKEDYLTDLDFMFVDEVTLSKMLKAGRKAMIAGREFTVPSLDHLIALKLHSLKHNLKHRKTRDLPDIVELIRINKVDAQDKGFKEMCLKYGTEDLYSEIMENL